MYKNYIYCWLKCCWYHVLVCVPHLLPQECICLQHYYPLPVHCLSHACIAPDSHTHIQAQAQASSVHMCLYSCAFFCLVYLYVRNKGSSTTTHNQSVTLHAYTHTGLTRRGYCPQERREYIYVCVYVYIYMWWTCSHWLNYIDCTSSLWRPPYNFPTLTSCPPVSDKVYRLDFARKYTNTYTYNTTIRPHTCT